MHESSILFDKQIRYLHQLILQWTDSKPMIALQSGKSFKLP